MDLIELNRACDTIADADPGETAKLVVFALRRLGYHGRSVSELIVGAIHSGQDCLDADLVEGLAQIESVEGVLNGRTDSL